MFTQSTIQAALRSFVRSVTDEGGVVETDELDLDALTEAVNDEGGDDALSVLIDLHDSIGLEQFGVFVE